MNSENLIPQSMRTQRERKEISRKGAIRSNEVQRKNKEDKRKNQRLVDILRNILSSKVTSKGIKSKLKEFGIDGDDYFTAMCVFAIIKALKRGDFNVILKLIELIDRKQDEDNSDTQDQSFNNLIEAIKHVRKTKPKTK